MVRQLQEKYLAKHKKLYFAFVDFEKAFDRVPWDVIWWAMCNMKYKQVINDLQQLIENKNINFISSKLTENTGKPKELWKILKRLGMPSL